jgi:hypothetical protein
MIKDLTGMVFGKLTVIKLDKIVNSRKFWLCKCECGNIKSVYAYSLHCGDTRSCGCLRDEKFRENNTKHGMSRTKIYKQWHDIKERCFNKRMKAYKNYGGRGITICAEWKSNFQTFYDWTIQNGYKQGLSIDRINNNGNYEPCNCKWSTRKEQGANRRTNRIYTVDGYTDILFNLCKKYNIHMDTVRFRLGKGMSIELALKKPLQQGKPLESGK